MNIIEPVLQTLDGVLAWISTAVGQLTETYCFLESTDQATTLAAKDGSLVSIIKLSGVTYLVGPEEFDRIHKSLTTSLQIGLSRPGHAVQFFYQYDKSTVTQDLTNILQPAKDTAERLNLEMTDLFSERINYLKNYCATESLFLVIWTCPGSLTKVQAEQAQENRATMQRQYNIPPLRNAQNFLIAIPELRNTHKSFVNTLVEDLGTLGFSIELLEAHAACREIRKTIDPDFTDLKWEPCLPGDKIPIRETKHFKNEISETLWPPLAAQLIPRDAEIIDLKTVQIGDKIYSTIFIDLFPKDINPFVALFRRLLPTEIPWRISYLLESNGMEGLGIKPILTTILSFASENNKLINQSLEYLKYIQHNTDTAIVKLRICATTWAQSNEMALLKTRTAELAKALQGWGHCEVSDVSGDPFGGTFSSALALSLDNHATVSIAPLNDAVYMMPLTRPASPWNNGAVLFRSYDGKPWPYQPGSTLQTTWIDIIYARPGSGKSVLANSINLALCLSAGLQRLPLISIIDIGPSSSGLISLIHEALPSHQKHLVAYHRLRMTKDMAINPFDTQLGARYPLPQDRAFLVNFLTLLATPVGETKAYDGITDMAGLIINEMYKSLADDGNPHLYTANLEPKIDEKIKEYDFKIDAHTTWWEIVDQFAAKEEYHLAGLAQRYAVPLLADAASICRTQVVADLYVNIQTPTGESLINAFGRMISGAVREYPILSQVTAFDLGEARIVSLDLDEVAKTGGEAAERQTAVMYMLARYILGRNFFLVEDSVNDLPDRYKSYHLQRIKDIREDPKRIVFDEFHRTSKAKAVRDQVLSDMREGRKWKVQVALLSQAIEDFDPVMIEFATSIFIMDAGPKQAIEKSAQVFGLSPTAKLALENRVHGPRSDGATFLGILATKSGVNTQLLTSTIGPIELWALNTTAEDARLRNMLYERVGASKARKILAMAFPSGSAAKVIEERMNNMQSSKDILLDQQKNNLIEQLMQEVLSKYQNIVIA